MHALLRPSEGRTGTGLRQGLPDRQHPVRRVERVVRPRRKAGRGTARVGRHRRLSLRRSGYAGCYRWPETPERLLPADGQAGGLQPSRRPHPRQLAGCSQFPDRAGGDGRTDAGRRGADVERQGREMNKRLGHETWDGETYYGQPSVKPSPFDWKVAAYVYVAGIAGSSQIIATMADRLGDRRDESIVRNGRAVALAGALIGAPLLIVDLKTPERFYNMLRIYRTSSPMSFGSYILTGFGLTSALTALGHLMGERRRDGSRSGLRRAADMAQVPATFLGAGMSTYTAAMLSATSTPLWAASPRAMAVQFGTSSMATAAAALSLGEQIAGNPENCRRLDGLAAISAASELVASALAERRHHEVGVGETLREGPVGTSYKAGALALGLC